MKIVQTFKDSGFGSSYKEQLPRVTGANTIESVFRIHEGKREEKIAKILKKLGKSKNENSEILRAR